jgi:tetratricopeptide (TPR) repeat protein
MWFLVSFLLQAQAADLSATQATIEQAQGLALKKNRQEACATLVHALSEAGTNKTARTKLSETLNTLSRVFFTDKGQRAFEAAQSQMFDNPDLALTQFRGALALEDENLAILLNIAKIQLAKQDCDGAAATLLKARTLNPLAGEPAVLELRTALCQNNAEEIRSKSKLMPALEKWEEQYVQYILGQEALQEGNVKRAAEILGKVVEDAPQFPEAYIFLAKADAELERDNEAHLQKYTSLCKAVTTKERKRYSLEPRLCAHLKEAQDELAKKSTDL